MVAVVEQMTSAEAAQLLGVSSRQVARLVATGDLTQVRTVGRALLIDATSVHRLHNKGARQGRPWTDETTKAAIDILTDGHTGRLTQTERSRLRARLRRMSAQRFTQAMSRRAQIRRYRASSSFLDMLRREVTLTGSSAIDADRGVASRFGLAAAMRDTVDGYVDPATASRLVRQFHLVDDADGNVTLRVVEARPVGRHIADDATVALDLAESLDVRERSTALALRGDRLAALT